MSKQKVLILGCGFMGAALLRRWLRSDLAHFDFVACTRTTDSLSRLQTSLTTGSDRVTFISSDQAVSAAKNAAIIVLGFLPGQLLEILAIAGLADALASKTIISLLAGVSIQQILDTLTSQAAGSSTKDYNIIRVIPTIAAEVGQSATLLAINSSACNDDHMQAARGLLTKVGGIAKVPERFMDEATAIGAAIHALTIVAVDSAVDASVASGVPRDTALAVVTQSLVSSAALLTEAKMSPEQVKTAMSTPAGITLNAVVNLDAGVRVGVASAVRDAIRYTRSMS